MKRYRGLASRFIDNFKKFTNVPGEHLNLSFTMDDILEAGPRITGCN
jgi:hypothetical protein